MAGPTFLIYGKEVTYGELSEQGIKMASSDLHTRAFILLNQH